MQKTSRPGTELEVLFSRDRIAARVVELGAEIGRDYAGESVLLIGVLKGAAIFLADLVRAIPVQASFDFVALSSYGDGAASSGQVKLIKDVDTPIAGRNVILVEDILDTGSTLVFLRKLIQERRPKSLKIAACLDKPERRLETIHADYLAFSIPNHFVVGYGMDLGEQFRNLPEIAILPLPDTPSGVPPPPIPGIKAPEPQAPMNWNDSGLARKKEVCVWQ